MTILGVNTYCVVYKLKKAPVFTVSMRDLEYQIEKEARLETNLTTIILGKWHNLLNIFSKKDLNTLLPYQKYYYKIILEKEQKYSHAPLYKMSSQKLNEVKRYFDSYLVKKFIQISSVFYSSLVLFVKKLVRGIRFYINCQRLNAIIKKDHYFISLIEETLA